MPFDFASSDKTPLGSLNYHAGLAAEDCVASHLECAGYDLLERRWRGQSGEVDLIFRGAEGLIFVEVKKADSHAAAAERLTVAQISRIMAAAEEYADLANPGTLTPIRVDAALVDATGRIDILENISIF